MQEWSIGLDQLGRGQVGVPVVDETSGTALTFLG